jgi:hypothetical protein
VIEQHREPARTAGHVERPFGLDQQIGLATLTTSARPAAVLWNARVIDVSCRGWARAGASAGRRSGWPVNHSRYA